MQLQRLWKEVMIFTLCSDFNHSSCGLKLLFLTLLLEMSSAEITASLYHLPVVS